MKSKNSFNSEQILAIDNKIYKYFDLNKVAQQYNLNLLKVPISLKILLENLLRNEDGESINKDMISSVFKALKIKAMKIMRFHFFQQEY